MSARKKTTVTVTAGTVEAWTTGDDDILESELLTKLRLVQEDISAGKKERGEVLVVVTK